jgi:hypothetical protein
VKNRSQQGMSKTEMSTPKRMTKYLRKTLTPKVRNLIPRKGKK